MSGQVKTSRDEVLVFLLRKSPTGGYMTTRETKPSLLFWFVLSPGKGSPKMTPNLMGSGQRGEGSGNSKATMDKDGQRTAGPTAGESAIRCHPSLVTGSLRGGVNYVTELSGAYWPSLSAGGVEDVLR